MAYLRWSTSNWYIFWHHNGLPEEQQTRENQLLAIWHCTNDSLPVFSFLQLEKVKTVADLKKLLNLDLPDHEYLEALAQIEKWRSDLEVLDS